MPTPFLLYGSYGYSGSLIAELALSRGFTPILSGRDASRVNAQAQRLGLQSVPVALDAAASLEVALKNVPFVLNCAGPFIHTYKPMVEACLRTGRHYLDITGEIGVLEALAMRDEEARQAGVMLLPGAGFDVVPSDCLAAHLKRRLPGAKHLTLGICTLGGGISRGTLLSAVDNMATQGTVRKEGRLVQVPMINTTRQIDFGSGPKTATIMAWGDISTAYRSTGIPNIEVYMVQSKSNLRLMRIVSTFIGTAAMPLVQWLLGRIVKRLPAGPSAEMRQAGKSLMWGQACDEQGNQVSTRMEMPEGYSLTAETALCIAQRVLEGDFKPGFQTPSSAYGPDFILEFDGVTRLDL